MVEASKGERQVLLRCSVRCVVRTLKFHLLSQPCLSLHSNPLHDMPLHAFSAPVRASVLLYFRSARETVPGLDVAHNNKRQLLYIFLNVQLVLFI